MKVPFSILCGLDDLELSDNSGKHPTAVYTPSGLFISSFLNVLVFLSTWETCFQIAHRL